MDREQPTVRALFASGMIALSIVRLRYGDFAMGWQAAPTWDLTREVIADVSAALMVLGGIGLLFERTAAWSASVLFLYSALWVLFLKVPGVLKAPLVEGSWQEMAEIVVLLAGGWVLFAALGAPHHGSTPGFATGKRGLRLAQILFGLALLPLGLAHFVYLDLTARLVPAWLP
jgi:uncharacterized membrane protein